MEISFRPISLIAISVLLTSDGAIISQLSFMVEKKYSPKEANKRAAKRMTGSPRFPDI